MLAKISTKPRLDEVLGKYTEVCNKIASQMFSPGSYDYYILPFRHITYITFYVFCANAAKDRLDRISTKEFFQTASVRSSKRSCSCGRKNPPQCLKIYCRHNRSSQNFVDWWFAKNNAVVDWIASCTHFLVQYANIFFTKKPKTTSGNQKCSSKK